MVIDGRSKHDCLYTIGLEFDIHGHHFLRRVVGKGHAPPSPSAITIGVGVEANLTGTLIIVVGDRVDMLKVRAEDATLVTVGVVRILDGMEGIE